MKTRNLKTPFLIKKSILTSFSIDYQTFLVISAIFFLIGSVFYIYIQSMSSVKNFENYDLQDKKQLLEKEIENADSEIISLSKNSRIDDFLASHPEFVEIKSDPIFLDEKKS